MKVLIITNMYPDVNPEVKYAGIFVKEQADAVARCNDVDFDIYVINGFKSKFIYLTSIIPIYAKILLGRYDVIHIHYGLSAFFILFFPFKFLWKNVVITLHGGDILSEQGKIFQVIISKFLLTRVGYVIGLNEQMKSYLSSKNLSFDIIPCGVDSNLFSFNENKVKSGKFIFPGSIKREVKNFSFFNSVIECYRNKFGNIEFVELDGLSRSEVKDIMTTSDALIMTSISEGSPQSIKEALSCDLPVISSNVGDVAFLVGDTPGTKIFNFPQAPCRVAELINEALIEAKTSPGVRRQRLMSLRLDNANIANRIFQIYKGVSSNHGS